MPVHSHLALHSTGKERSAIYHRSGELGMDNNGFLWIFMTWIELFLKIVKLAIRQA